MSTVFKMFQLMNMGLSVIAPSWIAKRSQVLFISPRMFPPQAWEVEAADDGERFSILPGISAVRWKPDGEVRGKVLLVHGWEGRATQMAAIAQILSEQGYEALAVDMPAHGQSDGKQSHIVTFAETMLAVQKKEGKFDMVVAHSLGGPSTAVALSRGLRTNSLMIISSPTRMDRTLYGFANMIGLNENAAKKFVEYMHQHVGLHPKSVDIPRLLAGFEGKVQLIHDESDRDVPLSDARRTVAELEGAELLVTSGLGHRRILSSQVVLDKVVHFAKSATGDNKDFPKVA